jgi:hypothetical protein
MGLWGVHNSGNLDQDVGLNLKRAAVSQAPGRKMAAAHGVPTTRLRGIAPRRELQVEYLQLIVLSIVPMVVSAAIHHTNRLVRATRPARRVRSMERLHRSHLPFQTIDTRVAGVIGMSANDHSHREQSHKTQRGRTHINLLMRKRRGRSAFGPFRHLANFVVGRLS